MTTAHTRRALCHGALIAGLFAAGADAQNVSSGQKNFPFEFALIGDTPYGPTTGVVNTKRQVYPPPEYLNTIADINRHKLEFVAHVGDIKAGDTLCEDNVYSENLALFNQFKAPVIFVPGDNEWTDCHRATNGGMNPIERLAFLRSTFYTDNKSLGQRRIDLLRQSEDAAYALYKENVIWNVGTVLFVGLHVPGSNNNRNRTTGLFQDADAEYTARNAANMVWLDKAFDIAENDSGIKAIMILIQANPFERFLESPFTVSGFADLVGKVRTRTIQLDKQVVMVNGDTHYFRMDKPLLDTKTPARRIEHFTRLEVFAQLDTHWVKVRVEPNNPNVFVFEPMTVAANVANH